MTQAIAGNKRLDGGERVLREGKARKWRIKDDVLAPVVLSSSEVHDHWPQTAELSTTAENLRRFEKLSLAARLTFAAHLHKSPGLLGNDGPQLSEDEEAKNIASGIGLNIDMWPTIQADDIVDVLAAAAAALDLAGGRPPSHEQSLKLHHRRSGLNIYGARIVGDIKLYNAILPFPVRLICCVIDGTLIADHAQIASLDISGSAMRGISANFLKLNGSLRLRRSYCAGPADFGAANIGGVLDLSDSIITPLLCPPQSVAFAGDRGAVNLSLATIENELRLTRARIYGGLTMKGAVVRRSVFFDKALICSPIASLAKMALDSLPDNAGLHRLKTSMATDDQVAAAIFPDPKRDAFPDQDAFEQEVIKTSLLRKAEVHGLPMMTQNPSTLTIMHRLLAESMRARTCSVRADGTRIEGSVFARGLVSMGRLRIKYGHIQGGFHLDGTRLRSPQESFGVFDELRRQSAPSSLAHDFLELQKTTEVLAKAQEKGKGENYALDIRETKIDGTLSLGPANLPRKRERRSRVHGAIVASQAQIGSGLFLQAVEFTSEDGDSDKATVDVEHTTIGCDLDLRDAEGIKGIKASFCKISGNLFMCAAPETGNNAGDAGYMVQSCRAQGKIEFRSSHVRGDAWLVFDRNDGPALLLGQMSVDGSLNIMPMIKKIDCPENVARNDARREVPTIGTKSDFREIVDENNRRWRSLRDGDQTAKLQKPPPLIDLRSAKANVFCTPPRAWPHQDALHLVGFVYSTTGDVGPLGVGRFLAPPQDLVAPRGGAIEFLRRSALAFLEWTKISPALPSILIAASVISPLLMWALEKRASISWHPIDSTKHWQILADLDRFGLINLGLLLGLALFCSALGWMSRNQAPTKYDAKPLGTYWLRLQAHQPNPFRRNKRYAPTDPYLRAANALREVGKVRSAEWIELERVRARTRLLSLRHHFLARVALWIVDGLADYGFNVARVVFILAFTTLIGACVFEWSQTGTNGKPAQPVDARPSILLSLETVVPLLKNGEDQKLAGSVNASKGQQTAASTTAVSPGSKQTSVSASPDDTLIWVKGFAWLLRAFGIVLSAVIGASLAARAEAFLSRMQS